MDTKKIGQGKKQWEETTLQKMLAKSKERKPAFKTLSGIELERLYSPTDVEDCDYSEQVGFPGEYPFTRGIQPTMYRGRFWTMRQYAGFGSAEDTNKRYKYLLEQGQTGLSVAFDLPTQMGYDSLHPLASGEVGKVGVAIDSLEDMERLFDGIPLDKVSTSMTINSTAAILLAMYMTVAEKQGVDPSGLQGTIQKHLSSRGVDADHHRHLCLLQPETSQMEHDQHQRIPHAGGGVYRRPGGGLHPGGRDCLCPGSD